MNKGFSGTLFSHGEEHVVPGTTYHMGRKLEKVHEHVAQIGISKNISCRKKDVSFLPNKCKVNGLNIKKEIRGCCIV